MCKIGVTGIIPAESHLQGIKHMKAVKLSKMKASLEEIHDSQDSPLSSKSTVESPHEHLCFIHDTFVTGTFGSHHILLSFVDLSNPQILMEMKF